jgi:hypothetical protein
MMGSEMSVTSLLQRLRAEERTAAERQRLVSNWGAMTEVARGDIRSWFEVRRLTREAKADMDRLTRRWSW